MYDGSKPVCTMFHVGRTIVITADVLHYIRVVFMGAYTRIYLKLLGSNFGTYMHYDNTFSDNVKTTQ
jgi:hypothetical protein